MRIDELVDGLVDPNATGEDIEALAEDEEAAIEADEADDDEDGSAKVSASMLQLKQDALMRFSTIHQLYGRMINALAKKGSQDRGYLRGQKQIRSEEHTSELQS